MNTNLEFRQISEFPDYEINQNCEIRQIKSGQILTNKMGHEKQAGMKVILDYLKQPDVSSTSPQTETVMKQKPLLRK
jgi:hypothetical protein